MSTPDREALIRRYAACDITWHELRERGFDDYVQVLAALGELGLRPPVARMQGPNVAARERGRAIIRSALHVILFSVKRAKSRKKAKQPR